MRGLEAAGFVATCGRKAEAGEEVVAERWERR